MISSNRPLSPHLQVYRPQITSILSILHRITGVALTVGTLLLTYWLAAAASGPEAFAGAQGLIGSIFGRLLLFGWTFALFYHLCNGIRHLAWDAGYGFEIETATRTGWIVVGASAALTLLCWVAGYVAMAGA
jgi:succinate dehydrogenase / fumarate reductase cytochrome b subunit